MTPQQKELLEDITLDKIKKLLNSPDSSCSHTIALIDFSQKHQLFFPELYKFIFTSLINQNILNEELSSIVENYLSFNVSELDRNKLLYDSYRFSLDNLEKHFAKDYTYKNIFTMTLEKVFSFGVFFEADLLDFTIFQAYFEEPLLASFKDKNKENRYHYLNNILIHKKDSDKISKI